MKPALRPSDDLVGSIVEIIVVKSCGVDSMRAGGRGSGVHNGVVPF